MVQLNHGQFNRVQVGAMKCDMNSVQIYVQRWTRFSWTEIWLSLVQPLRQSTNHKPTAQFIKKTQDQSQVCHKFSSYEVVLFIVQLS